jgi:hypothetical protein
VILKRGESQSRVDFSRLRVDRQRLFQLRHRLSAVEFFQQQHASHKMRLPAIFVFGQRVIAQRIDDKIEDLRNAVPAGILRGAVRDQQQGLGVFRLILIVIFDEPVITVVGLFELAGGGIQIGFNQPGVRQVGVDLERFRDSPRRIIESSLREIHFGQARQQPGIASGLFCGRFQYVRRLLPVAARLEAATHPDRYGRDAGVLLRQALVNFERLIDPSPLPVDAGFFQRPGVFIGAAGD